MKTNKQYYLIVIALFMTIFTSCHNLEISGYNYYYIIKAGGLCYLLENDNLTMFPHCSDTTWEEGKCSIYRDRYDDCYIENNNKYFIGHSQLEEMTWNEDKITSKQTTDLEVFVEVNGIRKTYQLPGNQEGVHIVKDGSDYYYIFRSSLAGNEISYEAYYVSKNGEEPTLLAQQQEEIYSLRKAEIKRCKMINGKLYFVGVKDGVGFYCEATNLRTPYYVSGWNGGAYDILEKDSVLFVCGKNDGKAYVWKDGSPIELEFPNYAVESEARSMALAGDDLYVGGRIDEYPVIWKNGKIYATYFDFPPVPSGYFLTGFDEIGLNYKQITEEWGYVDVMDVVGDTIYSIVETRNYVDDPKRFVLEWYNRDCKVYCKYDFDLVEMLRNGQIEMDPSFYHISQLGHVTWAGTGFSSSRIAPRHVKGKRKK